MSSPSDRSGGHRFFRAIVLMGGSLAAGCGGQTIQSESTSTSNAGGSDRAGSGGEGPSAGQGGGGSETGHGGGGGLIVVPNGTGGDVMGSAGSGGSQKGPPPCSPAQWNCASDRPACDYGAEGWTLPENCVCDAARPKSAAECTTNQVFVCRRGTRTFDGHELVPFVPFECACAPIQSDCRGACDEVYVNDGEFLICDPSTDPTVIDILCGCACISLK